MSQPYLPNNIIRHPGQMPLPSLRQASRPVFSAKPENKPAEPEKKEQNIWRSTLLRYLGYANEIGQAVRPLLNGLRPGAGLGDGVFKAILNAWHPGLGLGEKVWAASEAIAWGYAAMDVQHLARKEYKRSEGTGGERLEKIVPVTIKAALFQLAASVIIPSKLVHFITHKLEHYLKSQTFSSAALTKLKPALPTIAGLALIPIIVKPLDKTVEYVLDLIFPEESHQKEKTPIAPAFKVLQAESVVEQAHVHYTPAGRIAEKPSTFNAMFG